VRHALDNFKIQSFQSANTLRELLSGIIFGLGNDSWIDHHSHIFGTLYYQDIFECIQFLLAHFPFPAHFNFKPVRLADSENRQIYNKIITGDWWWDKQNQLPAGATIVPVISSSNRTQLTNFSGNQHTWVLYLMIGIIRKDIWRTPKMHALIFIGLIPSPPKGDKNTDEVRHSEVQSVLSRLQHLDITGCGLKCNCANPFQRQCYPLLAIWVGDYPKQVMIAQVSYGSCPMCEIPKSALMWYSTCRVLGNKC
jgi:hypothetical protein